MGQAAFLLQGVGKAGQGRKQWAVPGQFMPLQGFAPHDALEIPFGEQVAGAEQGVVCLHLADQGLAHEAGEQAGAAMKRSGVGAGLCQQQFEVKRRAEQVKLWRPAQLPPQCRTLFGIVERQELLDLRVIN